MTASQSRTVPSLSEDAFADVFAKRDPKASKTRLRNLSRVAWVLTLLDDKQLKAVAEVGEKLPDLINVGVRKRAPSAAGDVFSVDRTGTAETAKGEGLGELLTEGEGRRRVDAYAGEARPLGNWAGPTAGPVDIERSLGIPRSTLNVWQRKGLVVGLLNGVRRNVYPTEQFVDAKPIDGLGDVLEIIGDARATWRWLKTAHPLLGGVKPLTRLQQGRLDDVLSAARANFVP